MYHLFTYFDMKMGYKRIMVAMDSMKGCLDSLEASTAVMQGVKRAMPGVEVCVRPVADGGEGMAEMVAYGRTGFSRQYSEVIGPLGGKMVAEWMLRKRRDHSELNSESCNVSDDMVSGAYIDFAAAAGLTLVEAGMRNPLNTTSFGIGELINIAIEAGVSEINLGLGGSSTVDGGLGALQALGLRLLNKDGKELPKPFTGGMLEDLADFELTETFKKKVERMRLTLLCDVDAPFTGERGAAKVFGPQKGADKAAVKLLEEGLERTRLLLQRKIGIDLNRYPGTGAAGGAAGGLMALAGGKIRKGASTLLDLTDFNMDLAGVDLIITGEGGSDKQTLMGKIPYEILRRGKGKGIPVWLVAGIIKDMNQLKKAGFERLVCVNDEEIIISSATIGENPLEPEVARRRIETSIFKCLR